MHHEIPPNIVNGLFTLGAAGVSGILTWFGGKRSGVTKGRIEGETRFIEAVKEAASLVITGLSEQHEECKAELAAVKGQIAEIMAGKIPVYHLNQDGVDGR